MINPINIGAVADPNIFIIIDDIPLATPLKCFGTHDITVIAEGEIHKKRKNSDTPNNGKNT